MILHASAAQLARTTTADTAADTMCAECTESYFLSDGKCRECPTGGGSTVLFVLVLVR